MRPQLTHLLALAALAALALALLTSCEVAPHLVERTSADGSSVVVVSGGGSVLTNSDFEERILRKGDLVMEHRVWKKDGTALPRYSGWQAVGTATANGLGDAASKAIDLAK